MTRLRSLALAILLCAVSLGLAAGPVRVGAAADTLPDRLTDQEFWKLTDEFSEPNGSFRSDNLVSNEIWFQWVIPDLIARTRPGGVYLGVGPEQNFTYIAALRPKMVFITDIRRGNLQMHLLYKALFEMTADRADFFAKLFNKPRPPGLTSKSTASELINAFWDDRKVPTSSEAVYKENLKAIQDHLTKKRSLPIGKDDLDGIEYIYWNFYWHGPAITYNSSMNANGRGSMAMYGDLMVATDGASVSRSYLASEEHFRVLKDLHERNMFVPVVGNFAGPKALRAVGRYLKEHGATVTAFYLSNVEQYLYQDGLWNGFCGNIASLPLDERSTFIRSQQGGGGGPGGGLVNSLGSMLNETRTCASMPPSQTPRRSVRISQ
jgi:hypothetical protein